MTLRTIILTTCLLLGVLGTKAQDEPEYRMEIGAGAGLQSYVGDLDANIVRGQSPLAGLVAKYKPTPRTAWSANLRFGKLEGSSEHVETIYPLLAGQPWKFKTNTVDFDISFEYNFWPYGTGQEYHGARPFTPFIALGMGLTFANADVTGMETFKKSSAGFQMPFGIGIKYKVANRLNLSAEWLMHFTGTDKLDGMTDPYGIKSSGLFKNTDCYSTLQLSLTYDLWTKCKTCMNDDD
jgi:hypothetical protein